MSPLPLGYTAPLMSATKVRIFFEFSISCEEIEYEEIVVEEMEPLKIDTIRVEPMEYGKRELFFVRTNFLVPLLNLGVEVPIGNRWSVAADYYFPWFFREESHERCFQVLAWNLEGRDGWVL